jgi:EmrB/QacA subfamily drug resistance transporter
MQYKWVALTVTTVGTLMAGIDTRIVIIGLPTIAQQLGADVEQVIWVSQAYLLASTIGLLLIGRVTDVIGRVKIYNIGFVIFTIGSALASISFTPYELIAARMVQGVGSAMLITNSAAILTDAAPKNELGTILGINQIAFRVGSVAGLTLSGVIISIADWRALFYINIPIGIFGTLWAHLRLKEIATPDVQRKMDWSGFATFSSGLTAILLAITFLSYGLSDTAIGISLTLAGIVLLLFFTLIETRKDSPLLDLKLFKIKQFAAGNLAQMLNALAWSGVIIMLSFYLQVVLGDSPLIAGLSLLPLDATFIIAGPLSGKLSDRYGARLFATTGLAISSAGFFILATVTSNSGYPIFGLTLGLLGIGNGMFVSPNISSIMGSVPPNRRGIASGFRTTTFNVGLTASSGLAVLLMTTVIPFSVLSPLIQGTITSSIYIAKDQFLLGFKIAVFVLAIINTFAIIPSMLRGSALKAEVKIGQLESAHKEEQSAAHKSTGI